MHTHIPFKAQLNNGKIVLSGDLDGSPPVRQECERIAKSALQYSRNLVVDAQQARLPPGGAETWSKVACEVLGRCQLTYLPSQLAQNLEYDDEYRHEHTTFLETDDAPVCAGGASASWLEPARRAMPV